MRPSPLGFRFLFALCFALLALVSVGAPPAAAQQIQVTAADPPTGEQGTVNLSVKVTGKGFKPGAQAKWFVTGTTNPGGVTVNSTAFVSSTELTANITIDDAAVISNFDIQVQSGGRTGKGTELFAVVAKGGNPNACTNQPLPAGISLIATLNQVNPDGTTLYGAAFGKAVDAGRLTLGTRDVLVVAVGGGENLEIFFLDPASGTLLDGTNIGSATQVQPHITIVFGRGQRSISHGDVNGDGVLDFALSSAAENDGIAWALVGSVTGGVLSYQVFPLPDPTTAADYGYATAIGDLDGIPGDEVVVGGIDHGKGSTVPGRAVIFTFNGAGFTPWQTIFSPIRNMKKDERFGASLAIGDVAGDGTNDLIVGAPNSVVNGQATAGRTFVFPGPVNASNYLTFVSGVYKDYFGFRVAAGDVDGGFADLIVSSGGDANTTDKRAAVFTGLVTNNQAPSYVVRPDAGLDLVWATTEPAVGDVNGDGFDDLMVGTPNTSCGGVTYLFLSGPSPLATKVLLFPPVAGDARFGWAVAIGPGTRLFFVGDNYIRQVYVYKLN
jgi:hypothetical protein